jgi:hypothetical protein
MYDAQPSHRVYPSLGNSTGPPCAVFPRPRLPWPPGSLADRAWLSTSPLQILSDFVPASSGLATLLRTDGKGMYMAVIWSA